MDKAKELGMKPLARIVAGSVAAVEPELMGYGPVPATQKLLARTGMKISDFGLIEVNEAFAVQYITVERLLGLNREITNVNGGAIALGHPGGPTGARLVVTLMYEMRRRGVNLGLATLCGGNGPARSVIIEATSSDTKSQNIIHDTDPGARYVGEFAIGVNPYVNKAMLDTLFDEKIAGSIHFTPGSAYKESDNGNKSTVHWDMVLIQTPEMGGGEIYFDEVLIRKDGRFVIDELKGLNPENLA
ncbi:MAG: putative acyltransferase [Methanomassiliicoccales archaeon PtaB.Bin215]|nr:MAG: putative acyltransferase [Methanomassiliicoccales archaeon PtaB.Bin215]